MGFAENPELASPQNPKARLRYAHRSLPSQSLILQPVHRQIMDGLKISQARWNYVRKAFDSVRQVLETLWVFQRPDILRSRLRQLDKPAVISQPPLCWQLDEQVIASPDPEEQVGLRQCHVRHHVGSPVPYAVNRERVPQHLEIHREFKSKNTHNPEANRVQAHFGTQGVGGWDKRKAAGSRRPYGRRIRLV